MDPEQKRCTGYNDNPANGSSPARIRITASRPLPSAGTPHRPMPAGPGRPPAFTAPPYSLACAMAAPPPPDAMNAPRAGTAAVVLPDLPGPRCTQQPSPHSPLACPASINAPAMCQPPRPMASKRRHNRGFISIEATRHRQRAWPDTPSTVTMPCTPPAPTLPRPRCCRPRPVGWRAASIATRRRGQQHPHPSAPAAPPLPLRCMQHAISGPTMPLHSDTGSGPVVAFLFLPLHFPDTRSEPFPR